MYLDYFGLAASPFSIATDPRFLYLSPKHREALAHLVFSTSHAGGFVVLTGEIGAGKTTICRYFLDTIPEQTEVAFIFNPRVSVRELLATICKEFRVAGLSTHKPTITALTEALNHRLLDIHSAGKHALLVIDEAQNLAPEVLEQVRLLTNLETTERKLLQIILIGQPQLQSLLRDPNLIQLSQRIVARYHLQTLDAHEVKDYITHRLQVAGLNPEQKPFSRSALGEVFKQSKGVPRLINVICDRSLLGAYVSGSTKVTPAIVKKAAAEVTDQPMPHAPRCYRTAVLTTTLLVSILLSAWHYRDLLPAFAVPPPPLVREASTAVTSPQPQPLPPASPSALLRTTLNYADNRHGALAALFATWGVTRDTAAPLLKSCREAKAHGLECHIDHSNWQQISRMNLPVVLQLFDDRSNELSATLVAHDEKTASLMIDGGYRQVPITALVLQWTGRFEALWKPAGVIDTPMAQLNLTPPAWVIERLGDNANGTVLSARVRAFQQQEGLTADGMIGVRTLIALSNPVTEGPRLKPD